MNSRIAGDYYESMAAEYLQHNGFQIIERNYKCKFGEIDIIAKKNNTISFIEVKYRKNTDFGYAIEAVSKEKQNRIRKTAAYYIKERKPEKNTAYSFDIVLIQGKIMEYYSNCFGGM